MTAAAEVETHEHRVGRIVVVRAAPADVPAGDRRSADEPALEVRCLPEGEPRVRSKTAVALSAVLAAGLLAFAIIVRSWPAIGAVSVAIAALGWLVFVSRSAPLGGIVRVVGDELRVIAPGRSLKIRTADVEAVALGEDRDALRTVWARVKGEGRVLLFEGLTPEEAGAALEQLTAALRP